MQITPVYGRLIYNRGERVKHLLAVAYTGFTAQSGVIKLLKTRTGLVHAPIQFTDSVYAQPAVRVLPLKRTFGGKTSASHTFAENG